MAQRADGSAEDTRAAHEAAVALHVAWLVAFARAFRIEDGRELRLDADSLAPPRLTMRDGAVIREGQ